MKIYGGSIMGIKSLGVKVSLIVAVMIAIIIVVIIYIVSTQSSALILDLTAKESAAANVTLNKEMSRLQDNALMRANIIAYSNDVIDAILNEDDDALKYALSHYDEGLDSAIITDVEGNVILR